MNPFAFLRGKYELPEGETFTAFYGKQMQDKHDKCVCHLSFNWMKFFFVCADLNFSKKAYEEWWKFTFLTGILRKTSRATFKSHLDHFLIFWDY